ncbi:hypothetical protein BaRGS_00027545 [Batillaria attramentaria]|uniref:C2H2-type domain-containing protein n=1 Tax=Batillaria attramentaria TaxID=370345 RepID=A0ABD0K363_9CAEN
MLLSAPTSPLIMNLVIICSDRCSTPHVFYCTISVSWAEVESRFQTLPRPGSATHNTSCQRTYTCRTCSKVFVHLCSLSRHRKKCEGNFHLSCHLCGMKFYRRDHYRNHLADKHQAVDEKTRRKHFSRPNY